MTRIACLLLSLITPPIYASANSDFDAYVNERMAHHQVVGSTIVLIEDLQIKHAVYSGLLSANDDREVTSDTVFQVGSVSKPVAAWTAMSLVESEQLDLDAPISNYLSQWEIPDSEYDENQVTLRRLLSHTAGLSLGGYPGFVRGKRLPSTAESLAGDTGGSGSVFLFQEPGSGFSYSGDGYTLMQLVIEEVTGREFSDVAESEVLQPLGMASSSYAPSSELKSRQASPHGRRHDAVCDHDFRAQAAASLHTTGEDIARFAIANMTANPVLRPETVQLMHTPITKIDTRSIGLGFFVGLDGQSVGHGGSNIGWKAVLEFNPKTGDGIVIMTNSESGGGFGFDIVCRWDRDFGPKLRQAQCEEIVADQQGQQSLFRFISLGLFALAGMILAAIVFGVTRKKMTLQNLDTRLREAGFVITLLVALGGGLFFLTPIGAYLAAGVWQFFPTVDYLPQGSTGIVWAGISLCVALLFLCFAKRRAT